MHIYTDTPTGTHTYIDTQRQNPRKLARKGGHAMRTGEVPDVPDPDGLELGSDGTTWHLQV